MQRLNYQLKQYIKAVEAIAKKRGLSRVKIVPNKGSKVRFELFENNSKVPTVMWVVHHSHDRKQTIWSKDDYRKAADRLCCDLNEFIDTVNSM